MSLENFFNELDLKTETSLAGKFADERLEWNETVEKLSGKMKKIFDIPTLMTEIYTERSRCLEYYHYLISISIKLNRNYRAQQVEKYEFWTHKSQIRYPNETSKNNKILTQLADIVEQRETIDNHAKFILSTVSTIDNIIYAIPKRVEIEQMSRGK